MEDKITPAYALDLINEQHMLEKKRLWTALLIVFIAFVGSNVGWIIYESQYEEVVTTTQTVTQDSGEGGDNTFTGDFYGGDVNGETNSNQNGNESTP